MEKVKSVLYMIPEMGLTLKPVMVGSEPVLKVASCSLYEFSTLVFLTVAVIL